MKMIENKSHGTGKNAEGGKGYFSSVLKMSMRLSCSCLHDYRGLGNGFQGQILVLISPSPDKILTLLVSSFQNGVKELTSC